MLKIENAEHRFFVGLLSYSFNGSVSRVPG